MLYYSKYDYSIFCYFVHVSKIYPIGIPSLYFTLVKKYSHILSDQAALEMEAAYNYPHVGHVLFLVEV